MRIDILENEKNIKEWINLNQSKSFMCKKLKCKPSTLNFYLKKMGINYAGNPGGKGIKKSSKRKTALEYIKSDYISSNKLKKKLIQDGIKEKRCEECKNEIWNGKDIPLELHHKDGNRFNNKFENLQIICPNCHSQTETFRGKNINKNIICDDDKLIIEFNLSDDIKHLCERLNIIYSVYNIKTLKERLKKINLFFKKKSKSKKNKCLKCNKAIDKRSLHCVKCYLEIKPKKAERPLYIILINEVKKIGYSAVGRKYGVSDNAIRKWIKSYIK